jgi:hypothetical protein
VNAPAIDQSAVSLLGPQVAIGPCMEGFGSWDWLGADLARGLGEDFRVSVFSHDPPAADVTIFIKQFAPLDVLRSLAPKTQILYCPVDAYGSAAEIDADAERLLLCRRIIIHAPRLRPYFQSYARVESLEHHVKHTIPTRGDVITDGPILWVGVRSNLAPLVAWVNDHPLPRPLVVLTNPERSEDLRDPANFGFRPTTAVQLATWSPQTHRDWLSRCSGALDIKGDDFRARHKPAAKALDFLASGLPLAMNPTASSVETVRRLGFEIASVAEPEWWLSAEYARRTQAFGRRISTEYAFPRLRQSWRRIVGEVLHEPPTIGEGVRGTRLHEPAPMTAPPTDSRRTKIAIVSLLFNWPSTGGGTVHTAELAKFLTHDGYAVRHLVVQNSGWQVGQVQGAIDWPLEYVPVDDSSWRRETILASVREALRRDPPDYVILTDSWSFKPRLAEAVGEYPYFVRIAAQELLCPLNNVRLLWDERTGFRSCPQHQLATPETCRQ